MAGSNDRVVDSRPPSAPDEAGDAAAATVEDRLTALFEGSRDALFCTAYFVLQHRDDAAEAVQDAFIKCWRRREHLDQIADLTAFVFTVTLNAAKDLRRRRKHRTAHSLHPETVADREPNHASPSTAIVQMSSSPTASASPSLLAPEHVQPGADLERREIVERVRDAITKLPETEREVFLLRQNGELTYAQIADALGAPEGTVKTRMRSALRKLRAALGVPLDLSGTGARPAPDVT